MSTVTEIEAAIRELPPHQARALATRLQGYLGRRLNGSGKKPSVGKSMRQISPLQYLARAAARTPADLPADAAAQHDHYLYGVPKRR
jgi:hypothetical protein